MVFKLPAMLRRLIREDGQDLVEYALLVALIAFATTAGIGSLATSINSAFSKIGTKMTVV
jgi:pilus assembly protein Flp/PilA